MSSITIPKPGTKINQENPYEILLKISSNSTCILIFEKCDEYSAIDVHSQIAFRYPLYVILKETKTNSTKTRLKLLKYMNVLLSIVLEFCFIIRIRQGI